MHDHRISKAPLLEKVLPDPGVASVACLASLLDPLLLLSRDIEGVELYARDHFGQSILHLRVRLGKERQLVRLAGSQINRVGLFYDSMKVVRRNRSQTVMVFPFELLDNVLGKLHSIS